MEGKYSMEEKETQELKVIKEKKLIALKIPKLWLLGISVTIALIVVILCACIFGKETEKEIITSSTLEKIVEVSELSTFEAVYDGIAQVMNKEDKEKTDYYVSYKSKIKAGIDFKEVKINVDRGKKIIVVTMPEIKITKVNVDIASLDYIVVNKKLNTETISIEAYAECEKDAKREITKENAIYELAEQNAENIIEALIMPFVKELDSEYKLEFKGVAEQ